MAKKYDHLSLSERDKITTLLYERKSFGEMALVLGRSKSTIPREIQRNASPEYKLYLSHRAHGRFEERRKQSGSRPRPKNKQIVSFVGAKLKEGWSPEQIAGRLPKEHPGHSISHEAIYQYIYHPETPARLEMIQLLRRAHRKRKNKGIGRKARKTKIPNRISIEQRPPSVETRKQAGHWEGDSLVSRKSRVALHSLVERKSRLLMVLAKRHRFQYNHLRADRSYRILAKQPSQKMSGIQNTIGSSGSFCCTSRLNVGIKNLPPLIYSD